jgi:HlyD family secretion protein
VGATPEHKIDTSAGHPESVAWIGRDHRISNPDRPAPADLQTKPVGRRKWIIGATVAAIAVAVGAAIWMSHASKPAAPNVALANRESIPLVSVLSPGNTAVTSAVTFTGAIAARYDMPIGIDGDAGRIVAVNVEAGDHVKRGQLLAKLDDSVLVQQVNRLAAQLEQARAQAALSEAEYRRAKGVEQAGALSAEEIEKRRATSVTDAANVKVVAAQLAEYQARLNRTRVIAPTDGTLLTRRAEVGQIASPGGDALFRLASGGEVEMRGQVAEQDLAILKTNQLSTVRITGLSRPFEGHVRLLGAVIDPLTRLGEIRIALKPDPALRPGAFAHGSVIVEKAERPVVPQTAVMSDSKGSYVFIINAQNQVERHSVQVGGTIEAGVIITDGLKGTERVVITAGGFLREGEKVQVAPVTAEPASTANPSGGPDKAAQS